MVLTIPLHLRYHVRWMTLSSIVNQKAARRLRSYAFGSPQWTSVIFIKIKKEIFLMKLKKIGLLTPTIAGAAMALSSISVVGNALRLKYSD